MVFNGTILNTVFGQFEVSVTLNENAIVEITKLFEFFNKAVMVTVYYKPMSVKSLV